jgi:hypothetical protein
MFAEQFQLLALLLNDQTTALVVIKRFVHPNTIALPS